LIRENVGSQDQTLSAYGGLNIVEFMPNGEVVVSPVIMKPETLQEFESRLMLVFTGHSRNASEVAAEQIRALPGKLRAMAQMKDLVDRALALLTTDGADLDAFGPLLSETWEIKRELSPRITTPEIDAIHQAALRSGALGGKLLGAGGGGLHALLRKTGGPRTPDAGPPRSPRDPVPFRFRRVENHRLRPPLPRCAVA
jgi:D-glycero-alpha-D-manno-heptose-7-phosphate kinase